MTTIDPVRVLAADPPWPFADRLPGGRGAEHKYPTLTISNIQRFPLPPLADDALLLLWRMSSMVEEAYLVARAWGFVPKSEIVWVKTGPGTVPILLEEGDATELSLHMGLGHYVRGAHETAIVARRGVFKAADKSVRSVLFAPVGEHSEKPDLFYALAERLGGGGPYAELFGRKARAGWHVFGNALPGGYAWLAPLETSSTVSPTEPSPPPDMETAEATRVRVPHDVPPIIGDAWEKARALAEANEKDDSSRDLSEVSRLPRHKVRRPDGAIVLACCAECRQPQYVSPEGVICTQDHGGASSLPGCEHCGLVDQHALECEALGSIAPPAMLAAPPVVVPPAPKAVPEREIPESQHAAFVARAHREGILTTEHIDEGVESAWVRLQYLAPATFFEAGPQPAGKTYPMRGRGDPALPGERIDLLVTALGARGIHVSLLEVCRWSVVRRDVARLWLEEDNAELPDWLLELKNEPKHAFACSEGNGCIGADAGCPAAIRAWNAPPPNMNVGFDPGTPSVAVQHEPPTAPVGIQSEAAPLVANTNGGETKAKRGRGRPPGARNKRTDPWAAARAASAESADLEVEEGFYS